MHNSSRNYAGSLQDGELLDFHYTLDSFVHYPSPKVSPDVIACENRCRDVQNLSKDESVTVENEKRIGLTAVMGLSTYHQHSNVVYIASTICNPNRTEKKYQPAGWKYPPYGAT